MDLRIGTQSWAMSEWNGVFYDEGTPAALQLQLYAEEFDYVEVDATFYGTPPSSTVTRWTSQTSERFRFSPKMPREITHERAFRGCDAIADQFFARMLEFGAKLAPILVQLPPALDAGVRGDLIRTLERRPVGMPCAVEFRHCSWFTHDTFAACKQAGIVIAAVDAPFIPVSFAKRTLERSAGAFAYLRLLGTRNETLPFNVKVIDRQIELHAWAQQLRATPVANAYVTTSNFYEGFAPETARGFFAALELPHRRRPVIHQPSLFHLDAVEHLP